MVTLNGTTVDTGEPSTAIASEISRSTVTNGSTPNVTTLENTRSKVKNGSSAAVETSEMSKSSVINYMWIYFAGGAGLLIIAFIVVLVIVIILLIRIRREVTKQTTENIPLDTRRHDHTDIALTSNQNETSSHAMCSNRNQYESVESVRFNPVPRCSGTNMFGTRRDGSKVLAKVHSCSDLTGSHHYSDVSNPRDVQAPHKDFDTQTRSRRLSHDEQTGQSGMARGDTSDSNGNGNFNNLHPTLSRNTRQTDDFNIHAFESSTDGWYQKLPKPGHKYRVQDTSSYDRCPGLSFDKGSKGNGNDS
ncbi:uncharacterized protein LOC110441102 [Mizuhopecten yessoensis]|nr:uncharacterized protein LOC110441102 [Mizuhopecten yessoensis]